MVQVVLHGPEWFFGMDALLEGITAVIAILVCLVALRAFKVTREKKFLAFSACFGLLSLSFGVRALTDIVLEKVLLSGEIFLIGYIAHIVLAISSYLALVIINQKIKPLSTRILLYVLTIPFILLSGSYFLSFYGASFILLAFIAFSYWKNCQKICSVPSYLVFMGFTFIALAQPQFLLEVFAEEWHVAAHVTQFIGYLLLLFALGLVHKK